MEKVPFPRGFHYNLQNAIIPDAASAVEIKNPDIAISQAGPALSKRIAYKAVWVEPELMAEIKYRAKSAEGKVADLERGCATTRER